MSANSKPLAFGRTLHDLALLRSSDLDLSTLVPSQPRNPPVEGDVTAVQASVERSHEFVREAGVALRIYNRGEVDLWGTRVEDIRCQLEDVLKGLEPDA
jgi:hypothetical protein